MKLLPSLLATATLATSAAFAAPLNLKHLAPDALWLAHLDLDAFKQSSVGQDLIQLIKDEAAKNKDSALTLNFDAILAELHSLTAYGTSFTDDANQGVVLAEVGPKARSILDGLIAAEELSGSASKIKLQNADTYVLDGQLSLKFATPSLVLIGKSPAQIEKALLILNGKAPSYSPKNSKLLLSPTDNFFLVAAAHGFSQIPNLPPQARILQKTTGAQFTLGQDQENLSARLALATSSAEIADQLARIVEGMTALASFAHVGDEDITRLVQSLQVSKNTDRVNVSFSYNAEKLDKIFKALAKKPAANKSAFDSIAETEVTDPIGGELLSVLNIDASSSFDSLPRHAIDPDPATSWCPVGRPQWLRLELTAPALVREVQIAWAQGDSHVSAFNIETSANGINWTPLIQRRSSGKSTAAESYNVPDTVTRWIRIGIRNGKSTQSPDAIAELRLLGVSNQTLPITTK